MYTTSLAFDNFIHLLLHCLSLFGMRCLLLSVVLAPLITFASPLGELHPEIHRRQTYGQNGEAQREARQRAAAVKKVFQTAWDGYYKYT